MTFTDTSISGAYLIGPEPRSDERGFFARLWCRDEFARHGLNAAFVQCNDAFSAQRGTLRGPGTLTAHSSPDNPSRMLWRAAPAIAAPLSAIR